MGKMIGLGFCVSLTLSLTSVKVACPVMLRLFGSSPSKARLDMDLPEPDSPTMARVSPVCRV